MKTASLLRRDWYVSYSSSFDRKGNDTDTEQSRDKTRVKKFGPFLAGERINSASIEHGKQKGKDNETMPTQVLGIRLYTNRGRGLIARALRSEPGEKGIAIRDGVTYENVSVLFMDVPFNSGSVKGFFGRSDDSSDGKIYRLGIIWGRLPEVAADEVEVQFADTSDTIDREDLEETQQKLISAQKVWYFPCSRMPKC